MLSSNQYVMGIDIGGTNIRFGLLDSSHQLTAFESFATHDVFKDSTSPAEELSERILDYCGRCLNSGVLLAISIGFPSTINRERTVVLQTPNISCIPDNFAVVEELGKKLKTLKTPIFINRDVNFLLLFDIEDLSVSSSECVAGIYFGTGVGNAVIVGGKLLLGRNGVAAELGHLPVYGNGRRCVCGNIGCIETLVSGVALERIHAEYFPDNPIHQMFSHHMDSQVINDFLTGMAQIVAIEVNLFDPDCVILGGGIIQMENFPKEVFSEMIHRYSRKPYPEKNLVLRYSRPNQMNGPIGAAIYAEKRLANPNYF